MGIPGLFRWILERWPKAVRPVASDPPSAPIDNLYLDLNGLIHPAVAAGRREGSGDFEYGCFERALYAMIDDLFATTQPRELLYLAVDGIAPCAKLAQQRKRRFRTAYERDGLAKIESKVRDSMQKNGLVTPSPTPFFDTNGITPRTPFMVKCASSLRAYVEMRLSGKVGKSWHKNLTVIISDDSVPGEGEHKLLQHIRRTSDDNSLHHCVCGADGDLIMLALGSHAKKFTILRGDKWISISAIREYLGHEFDECRRLLPFPISMERVVNDLILVFTLVGCDFLPHLRGTSIYDNALDRLIHVYKQGLGAGYLLLPDATFDVKNVKQFLQAVAKMEQLSFQNSFIKKHYAKNSKRTKWSTARKNQGCLTEAQFKSFITDFTEGAGAGKAAMIFPAGVSKRSRKFVSSLKGLQSAVDAEDFFFVWKLSLVTPFFSAMASKAPPSLIASFDQRLRTLKSQLEDSIPKYFDLPAEDRDSAFATYFLLKSLAHRDFDRRVKELGHYEDQKRRRFFNDLFPSPKMGSTGARDRYYALKFKKEKDDEERDSFVKEVARSYLTGLRWVVAYYLKGCPSQRWFYPYNYPPLAVDLAKVDLFEYTKEFELGRPVSSITQLLCVLPKQSASLLDTRIRHILTSPGSPLANFYPSELVYDPCGAFPSWQWICTSIEPVPLDLVDAAIRPFLHICDSDSGGKEVLMCALGSRLESSKEQSGFCTIIAGAAILGGVLAATILEGRSQRVALLTASTRLALPLYLRARNRLQPFGDPGNSLAKLTLKRGCFSLDISQQFRLSDHIRRDRSSSASVLAQITTSDWLNSRARVDLEYYDGSEVMNKALREQIEFYFSDKNMAKDDFLKNLRNAEGFVKLISLMKFARVEALTEQESDVTAALTSSTTLELDASRKLVRRRLPWVEARGERKLGLKQQEILKKLRE